MYCCGDWYISPSHCGAAVLIPWIANLGGNSDMEWMTRGREALELWTTRRDSSEL